MKDLRMVSKARLKLMRERQHAASLADTENIICLTTTPSFQKDGPLEELPVKSADLKSLMYGSRAHSVDVTKQAFMQIKKKAI